MFPDIGNSNKVNWSEETLQIAKEIDSLDGKIDNKVNTKKVDLTVWQKYANEYGINIDSGTKSISLNEIMQKIENAVCAKKEAEAEQKKPEEEALLALQRKPVSYKGYEFKLNDRLPDSWQILKDGEVVAGAKSRAEAIELIYKMSEDDKRLANSENVYKHRNEVEAKVLKKYGKCNKNSKPISDIVRTKDGKMFSVKLTPTFNVRENRNMKTGKVVGNVNSYDWVIEIETFDELFKSPDGFGL